MVEKNSEKRHNATRKVDAAKIKWEDLNGGNINSEEPHQSLSQSGKGSIIAENLISPLRVCSPIRMIPFDGGPYKPESHMTPLEKMEWARLGISKEDLENLKSKAALNYDDLAKALLVTRATLINKKEEEKFNTAVSERIISLADIYSYGYEVFEDIDRFNQWMFRSNQALGGEKPYDLLDNQFGREEVRNLIGRIDYGVYS